MVTEMTTLATVEAKSHFSEVIDRASRGEEFVITKRGIPVVRIISIDDRSSGDKRKELLKNLRVFRQGKKTIREKGESWNEVAHKDHKW